MVDFINGYITYIRGRVWRGKMTDSLKNVLQASIPHWYDPKNIVFFSLFIALQLKSRNVCQMLFTEKNINIKFSYYWCILI